VKKPNGPFGIFVGELNTSGVQGARGASVAPTALLPLLFASHVSFACFPRVVYQHRTGRHLVNHHISRVLFPSFLGTSFGGKTF